MYKLIPSILILTLTSILLTGNVSAARLELSPSTGTFIKGCAYSIEVNVDPQGQPVNAAEFQLTYSPSQISIKDSSSQSGTQIQSEDEFPVVLGNLVNSNSGVITFSAGSTPLSSITGVTKLATINFDVNSNATTMDMQFIVDGFGNQFTTDSNVAHGQTNQDILTGVGNGSYQFVDGFCEVLPPKIVFDNPEAYAFNIDSDSNLIITITDNHPNASGVNIDTVKFYIDGVLYTPDDPAVSYTGDSSSYTFVIDPATDFIEGEGISVSVEARDFAGNLGTTSTTFNTVNVCPIDRDVICSGYDISVSGGGVKGNLFDLSVSNDGFIDIAAAGSSAALVLGAIPLILSLLSLPGAVLKFFGVLLGRTQEKPWGIVKDAITGKPISFAVCELYSEGSSFKISQVISDLEGRYGFSINPGSYRLEVKKTEFKTFSTTFQINEGQERYIYDVEMSPVTSDNNSKITFISRFKIRLVKLYNKFTKWFFILGFTISTISVLLDQRLVNVLIFILYLFIIALLVLPKVRSRAKYATVVSTKTNLRIPFAQVKIFDLESLKLVDTKTTNQDGYFDFYGEPGSYAVLAIARGYTFPSKENTYELAGPANSMIKIDLKRGGNKVSLLLDPNTENGNTDSATGNIHSPFS